MTSPWQAEVRFASSLLMRFSAVPWTTLLNSALGTEKFKKVPENVLSMQVLTEMTWTNSTITNPVFREHEWDGPILILISKLDNNKQARLNFEQSPVLRFQTRDFQDTSPSENSFLHLYLLLIHFPSAGLSAAQFRVDWLLDWSLAAKWAQPLVTQLAAAYPPHWRSKCDEGWAALKK